MRKNKVLLLLAVAAFAVFLAGVYRLLMLRFSSGDVYPRYSSLRSDPFGTKALYESLDGCCNLRVSRNYEPFENLKEQTDAVLFFPGAIPPGRELLPESFIEDLESFLDNGGRMVVTYTSAIDPGSLWRSLEVLEEEERKARDEKEKKKDKKDQDKEKAKRDKEAAELHLVSFEERWGIYYSSYPLSGAEKSHLASGLATSGLPETLDWGSELIFDKLDPAWKVIYEREGRAVLVERKMGKGTVILSSDSYFLSNEALVRNRHAGLLAWLVGDKKSVVFDEYFHGVAANPGVASLARRYRLHGLIVTIIVLVGLFIWKNSLSFVPPHSETSPLDREGALAEGKDSTSGLTNLLRRSIPGRDLLGVIFQEWKKSHAASAIRTSKQSERIDSIYKGYRDASFKNRDAVRAYNEISAVIKER